ncbi:DUF983 domain-containing protein [Flavobacterium sedimenticola]|uniref:DUF983 domain-containing protein n=1 Tax=Flavobacterium sedimenticola TaxID=3043286 RepID=A0ABT6XSU7_9FLAO|nr:DUF983 domain-containing protein [Flavobacterium sedimenticola]MDI9257867.1 DUF983 domain-containing protein [Flavobacterium sedimenticola]
MLKKGTKLYSILTGSCPKCHEENMYVDKNPYHLKAIYNMHESCSHCGLHYKIEPSFFYGAMYVSYALTVAIGVAAFIIAKVFIGLDLITSFAAIITALVILMPVTARLARNIYINIFVHYDKGALKK